MVKKNKSSTTTVGHASKVGEISDAAMRQHAIERYHRDYHFLRGVRPSSPDRDPYSWKATKGRAELNDHFYGLRDRREINMMLGTPHGFAHSRMAKDGHSVYTHGHKSRGGHMIGRRGK